MRVLICGDRYWADDLAIRTYILEHPDITTVIEGEQRGADIIARNIANDLHIKVLPFPANWDLYHKAAGAIRNKQMLDEGKPDLVVAFHNNIAQSKGTKNMIELAKKYSIPVELVRSNIS